MSAVAYARLKSDLSAIRQLVEVAEEIRSALGAVPEPTISLTSPVPSRSEWRIYDHSAVVTRTYACLAAFIESALADWLAALPQLWVAYPDLPEEVRKRHMEGLGRLLTQHQHARNRGFNWVPALKGLLDGLGPSTSYALEPRAYQSTDRNYGPDVLQDTLSAAGLAESSKWLWRHRAGVRYVDEVRGGSGTLDSELRQLIHYRNDAAHGTPEDILGRDDLLAITQLAEAVAESVRDLATRAALARLEALGKAQRVGVITEYFRKPDAVVARIANTSVVLGMRLLLQSSSLCVPATVLSIQLDGKAVESVALVEESEVGLRLSDGQLQGVELWVVQDLGKESMDRLRPLLEA